LKDEKLVAKYIDGLPYSTSYIAPDNQTFFYLKNTVGGRKLHALNLTRSTRLASGTKVSDIDFSRRSYIPIDYDDRSKRLFFISDDGNTENFNLYSLQLNAGTYTDLQTVTDAALCSQAALSRDFSKIVYIDRYKTQGGLFSSRLKLMDLHSGKSVEICDDSKWKYRFSWGKIALNPDCTRAILTVDCENQRLALNLILVDLESGKSEILLPAGEESTQVYCEGMGFDGSSFYYSSDRSKFTALYRYDILQRRSVEVLAPQARTQGLGIRVQGNQLLAIAMVPHDEEELTEIIVQRADAKEDPVIFPFNGSCSLEPGERGVWLTEIRIDSPQRRIELDLRSPNSGEIRSITMAAVDPRTLVHSTYRYLRYLSFDGLEIPAFLTIPKTKVRAAVITAFYGGKNRYDRYAQMLAESGVLLLSPAVRGSWGRGKQWEDMLKGDLGGSEILDLVWAARYLEREFGLPPAQIGLHGESHGGYAVLRAVTMPENFKGQASKYPFGFAICWAGFADLVAFHESSSIPDWLTNLLGPIATNRSKYLDRSPLTHFKELKTPLFISHGRNDTRVPLSTMQEFIDKLNRSDVPHEIHLQSGLGHSEPSRQELIEGHMRELNFIRRYGIGEILA
jgi:dienelactone hydrolase